MDLRDGALVGDPLTRAVYLLLDGQRRLVPDTATLRVFGFSLDDVQWAEEAALSSLPIGPNLLAFRVGDLVRDEETEARYLLDSGKRAIADATWQAFGLSPDSARPISSTLALALPEGDPLPALRAGDLIRSAEDGCLYLLAGGKHWLPPSAKLAACGWMPGKAHTLDPLVWSLIPEGDMLPSLDFGYLLGSTERGDERVYVLDGGKHLIPDRATFEAYGWQQSSILRLSPEVLAAIPEGSPLAHAEKGKNLFSYANWGQCTWYVAERRIVPSYRDARHWYADAKANGFAVGQRPMQGAIIVYDGGSGRGPYGHVAYVEATYADGSFVRADSNICGWECVRTRITDLSREVGVLGFVYWKYEARP